MAAVDLNTLLALALNQGASDVHLKAGTFPIVRVDGELRALDKNHRLDHETLVAMAAGMMTAEQRQRFQKTQEIDIAYSVSGLGRFRCNVFQQRNTIGIVIRAIPRRIRSIDDLALPTVLGRIAEEQRGLVLVTGTTGSGKTTTLAAMLDYINQHRACHIITVEDPIEYLHRDAQSVVNQREVGTDTPSFASALRSGMRQDPDVILVGEMRDLETIETALMAAETGHLVLSTLHTTDATETINRIISVFPSQQQQQIRWQLASVLRATVAMRLVPRADGRGRAPAVEVLIATPFVRDCIISPEKTALIPEAIASGTSEYGMQTFDQSIYSLYAQGLVTYEEAVRWASNVDEFKLRVQGISNTVQDARDRMATSPTAPAGLRGLATPAAEPASAGAPEITRFSR